MRVARLVPSSCPGLLLAALAVASASCGGSAPAPVLPSAGDPSPLAKCKVGASQNSPLVTEWPASEKAHLESLLGERAVAVEYSGCELRILDGCRLKGTYNFQRTTLSSDTVEIASADELFAKLPLGAVGLESQLAQSGRLAVRTTIAGQLRLTTDVTEFPPGSACAKATHVVSALSVGAFKLLSGGAASAKAGLEAGPVGGGVKTSREEQVLREAGDPAACAQTKAGEKNPHCSSPIQIFLEPLEHEGGGRAEASRGKGEAAEEGGDEQPTNGVKVNFIPPDAGKWALRSLDGKLLCDLPCTRWVGPKSGLIVQLDADRKEDIKAVMVPADLGYSAGRTVNAVPQLGRGGPWAGTAMTVGVLGAIVGWVMAANTKTGCGKTDASDPDAELDAAGNVIQSDSLCTPGIAIGVGSGALFVGGGLVWLLYNQSDKLDMTLVRDAAASRPMIGIGPGTLQGTF